MDLDRATEGSRHWHSLGSPPIIALENAILASLTIAIFRTLNNFYFRKEPKLTRLALCLSAEFAYSLPSHSFTKFRERTRQRRSLRAAWSTITQLNSHCTCCIREIPISASQTWNSICPAGFHVLTVRRWHASGFTNNIRPTSSGLAFGRTDPSFKVGWCAIRVFG